MEEEECGAALAILQDVVQLCELMRGETESCSFNSICSDCFTGIAMKHLCAPDPGKSTPCRILLPFIEQTLLGIGGGNGDQLNQNDRNEVAQTAAAAAAATEAAKLSMALAEERSLGMAELQARLDEQAKILVAKSAEVQALSAKNAALARALEEKPLAKAQSAGQELVQSGVQVTPLAIHAHFLQLHFRGARRRSASSATLPRAHCIGPLSRGPHFRSKKNTYLFHFTTVFLMTISFWVIIVPVCIQVWYVYLYTMIGAPITRTILCPIT